MINGRQCILQPCWEVRIREGQIEVRKPPFRDETNYSSRLTPREAIRCVCSNTSKLFFSVTDDDCLINPAHSMIKEVQQE